MTRRGTIPCKYISTEDAYYSGEAAVVIGAGGVVAIPTETSYGLAVDPFNEEALKRLFDIKLRSLTNPVLVLIDNIDFLPRLVTDIPAPYQSLIKHYWPGPLTLIFPALPSLPGLLTAATDTIGIRLSSNANAAEICRRSGGAITATSANISGQRPARSADDIIEIFKDAIDMVIDGGVLKDAPPSTVVRQTDGRLILVREGAIPFSKIQRL